VLTYCPDCMVYANTINSYTNATMDAAASYKCEGFGVDVVMYHTDYDFIPKYFSAQPESFVIGYQYNYAVTLGNRVLTAVYTDYYNIFYDLVTTWKKGYTKTITSGFYTTYGTLSPAVTDPVVRNFYDTNLKNYLNNASSVLPALQTATAALNLVYANISNGQLINHPSLVITQITLDNNYEYISLSNPVVMGFFIITVLISIGMFFNIVIVVLNREQNDVSLRHPVFLVCQNLGAIILLSSNYFTIGNPWEPYCYTQIVFLLFGFDLFYMPFLAKALRLYILFTVSFDKQVAIRDRLLYASIIVFIAIDSIICMAWFLSTPVSIYQSQYDSDGLITSYYISCGFTKGFLLGVLIYKTILCAIVWIVSDRSSQIVFKVKFDKERKRRFRKVNDAIDIKFGITFTLIVLVLILIVLLIVADTNPTNTFIALNITIWIATGVPLGLIMFYVYTDLMNPKSPEETTASSSTTDAKKTSSSAQKEASASL